MRIAVAIATLVLLFGVVCCTGKKEETQKATETPEPEDESKETPVKVWVPQSGAEESGKDARAGCPAPMSADALRKLVEVTLTPISLENHQLRVNLEQAGGDSRFDGGCVQSWEVATGEESVRLIVKVNNPLPALTFSQNVEAWRRLARYFPESAPAGLAGMNGSVPIHLEALEFESEGVWNLTVGGGEAARRKVEEGPDYSALLVPPPETRLPLLHPTHEAAFEVVVKWLQRRSSKSGDGPIPPGLEERVALLKRGMARCTPALFVRDAASRVGKLMASVAPWQDEVQLVGLSLAQGSIRLMVKGESEKRLEKFKKFNRRESWAKDASWGAPDAGGSQEITVPVVQLAAAAHPELTRFTDDGLAALEEEGYPPSETVMVLYADLVKALDILYAGGSVEERTATAWLRKLLEMAVVLNLEVLSVRRLGRGLGWNLYDSADRKKASFHPIRVALEVRGTSFAVCKLLAKTFGSTIDPNEVVRRNRLLQTLESVELIDEGGGPAERKYRLVLALYAYERIKKGR